MRKIYFLIGVLAMGLLSTSCQQQIDIEAAKTELLQVAQQFNKENYETGYIEGYNKYMAEDVLILPPGAQPIAGREKYYASMKAEGLQGQLEGEVLDAKVSASGDMGWTYGRWVFTVQDSSGNPVVSYGKYLCTWTKIDGQWKITSNIWNSNPKPEN
jgi:ketosteroid isomerase-like protein